MKSGFLPEKNKRIVPKSVIFIQMKISSLNVNPLKFNSIESHNILENSLLTNYGFRLDSHCNKTFCWIGRKLWQRKENFYKYCILWLCAVEFWLWKLRTYFSEVFVFRGKMKRLAQRNKIKLIKILFSLEISIQFS